MNRRSATLVALYAASGAAGLAWQALLVRAFVPVFGAGAEAIAAVTACFLGGLGVGGALAPRWLASSEPRRGLVVYARLEALAGLWGAALPWLLAALGPVLLGVLQSSGEGASATAVRLAVSAVTVGPLAVLLGATFPAVAVALRADEAPERVGLAYGVNAIGAAAGALVAGLWLPWALGLKLGAVALGVGNLVVAAGAWALARRAGSGGTERVEPTGSEPGPIPTPGEGAGALDPTLASRSRPAAAPSDARDPTSTAPRGLWALAFATGFIGMGLELSWSRVSGPLLAARSGSDAVAFSVVLAAVVLGIGVGGLLARRVRGGLGLPLALSQGLLAILTLLALEPARDLLLGARHLELVEGLLPLLPAITLGATFPLLSNALAEAGTPASKGLGRLYAVNTLGAVVGSLSTGFVWMPLLGAQRWLVVLAGGSALISTTGLLRAKKSGLAAAWGVSLMGLVVAHLALTPPVAGERLIPPFEDVLASLEGRQGSTLVSARPGGRERALTSSGHRIGAANTSGPVNDHELRARGPASLHAAPERVLLIGLGTGATARAFLDLPTVTSLTVVELDANMRRLLPQFGTEAILQDPRLTLVDGDGRWFVRAAQGTWDVIAVDAYDPRTASATFYTADFYREARARLADGGLLFVKFNPASVTEAAPLASYLATLWSAFDQGALVFVQRGLFGLVGVADQGDLQVEPRQIVADAGSAAPLVQGARLHTDDRPVRIPDRPGAQFLLLRPYWAARHGEARPPWAQAARPQQGGPPRR